MLKWREKERARECVFGRMDTAWMLRGFSCVNEKMETERERERESERERERERELGVRACRIEGETKRDEGYRSG